MRQCWKIFLALPFKKAFKFTWSMLAGKIWWSLQWNQRLPCCLKFKENESRIQTWPGLICLSLICSMIYLLFSMKMHEPDVGSIVTSIKGPNMVYHSKENISGERKAQCWTFISGKFLRWKRVCWTFQCEKQCVELLYVNLKISLVENPWVKFPLNFFFNKQ